MNSATTGSSPRARGTARSWSCAAPRRAVHPRVRGERCSRSPPARSSARFIPACAGNGRAYPGWATISPVHPRVRGERRSHGYRHRRPGGSSPRARGTVRDRAAEDISHRFIPACAGNGLAGSRRHGRRFIPACAGNAWSASTLIRSLRFIPACAGNRHGRTARWPSVAGSSPRARGTARLRTPRQCSGGSSPRARGTVRRSSATGAVLRFIPACAGNGLVHSFDHQFVRFIPACAGNAASAGTRSWLPPTVHPRVRGERTCQSRCRSSR